MGQFIIIIIRLVRTSHLPYRKRCGDTHRSYSSAQGVAPTAVVSHTTIVQLQFDAFGTNLQQTACSSDQLFKNRPLYLVIMDLLKLAEYECRRNDITPSAQSSNLGALTFPSHSLFDGIYSNSKRSMREAQGHRHNVLFKVREYLHLPTSVFFVKEFDSAATHKFLNKKRCLT